MKLGVAPMNFPIPLLKMWTQALLLSSSAVSFFVVALGIGIVPFKASDIWPKSTLSIVDCYFHETRRFAISVVWTHNYFGRVDHLVLLPLDGSLPNLQTMWPHLSPRALASDSVRDLLYVGNADGSVYSVDPKRLDRLPVLIGRHPAPQVAHLECSKDGRWLVSIQDDALYIWNLESKTLHDVWSARAVHSVALALDSKIAICGLADGSVIEVDLATSSYLRTIAKHINPVVRITVCPQGTAIASVCFQGSLIVLDSDTNQPLWQCAQGWAPPVLEFSEDGTLLISTGMIGEKTNLIVYRARSGERVAAFNAQGTGIRGAAMNRDRQLVSWGADGSLRIWDVLKFPDAMNPASQQPVRRNSRGRIIWLQSDNLGKDFDQTLAGF